MFFKVSIGGIFMDKLLSTRVDETVIRRLSLLVKRLNTSKKAVIERAIADLADRVETEGDDSDIVESFGAWQRDESHDVTRDTARDAFQKSMERHHQ
jgi:predicted transcriptional regulator